MPKQCPNCRLYFVFQLIDFDKGEFSCFPLRRVAASCRVCLVCRCHCPMTMMCFQILFLTSSSFFTFLFLFKQPPQHQLDDDADGWVMPHKKECHACLCRFMEFQCGFSVEFDSRGRTTAFTRHELLDIRPNDIQRFMALCAFDDPDCDVTAGYRPTHCRSSALEATKRALSCHVPHRTVPWCNNQGNPTRSAPVNNVIKEVKKFEVQGEGSAPSKAKRLVRPNEFSHAIRLLRSLPSFDCKHKHPMACLWQHCLIGRLDHAAHFEVKDPAGQHHCRIAGRCPGIVTC